MIILDFEPIVQSIAGGFSVREFTVMFHSVNEIAQFATIATASLSRFISITRIPGSTQNPF